MSFDRETRNKLARTVGDARRRLVADVTDSLRRLGLQDNGALVPLSALPGLSDGDKAASEALRAQLGHFAAQEAGSSEVVRAQAALARLVREIGFTTLNRLVALRMAEERGLIIESVRNGLLAAGFQLFDRIANGSLGTRGETYRAYLECLYDELAVDLPSVFSRTRPESLVFPSEAVLEQVLGLLNDPSLAELWKEDETIGWVYQYYNDPDERKKMRDASQAPRNSRELAVRNQFFTPRYVVEFLTDNTLGRTWYEMRQGDTRLRDDCRYLVRRPTEVFLQASETPPGASDDAADLSQDELLKQPAYVPFRARKDLRDLKILDPACGSGHFLLYAFDLLETIYQEAWSEDAGPCSHATGHTLRQDFPKLDELRRAVPGLILRHNLHGVDIDPRAVQIAGLALWLRAQRSYQNLGVVGSARPRLTKGNLVVAEPMPGERDLLEQFVARLDPPLIGGLVKLVFTKMQLAGEAGTLLKIEDELRDAISSAKAAWQRGPKPQQLALMPDEISQRPEQISLELDTSGISDESFWERVEERVFAALRDFAADATNADATRRRLFVDDAERGFAFVDLCRHRFDVLLMNPPFGSFSRQFASEARESYRHSYNDIFSSFVDRALQQVSNGGLVGAITSRTGFFIASFANWRERVILARSALKCLADLGSNVMDDATVEAAAYCLEVRRSDSARPIVLRVLGLERRDDALRSAVGSLRKGSTDSVLMLPHVRQFNVFPRSPFVYWVDERILRKLATQPVFEPSAGDVRVGLQTNDDFRFVRAIWEVLPDTLCTDSCQHTGNPSPLHRWVPHVKTGASQPWFSPLTLVLNWRENGQELKAFATKFGSISRNIRSDSYYFRPGFSWTGRAVRLIPYAIPAGCIPSVSRYMGFPKLGATTAALGLAASNIASAFTRFYGADFERPKHLVESVKSLPWPTLSPTLQRDLDRTARLEVDRRRRAYQNHEPFLEFTLPSLCMPSAGVDTIAFDRATLLGDDVDERVAVSYGLTREEYLTLTRDLREAVAVANRGRNSDGVNDEEDVGTDFVLGDSPRERHETLLSYLMGATYGRWDVRIACDPSLAPSLTGPFESLPVCPPGALVGADGIPATTGGITSVEWLSRRQNALQLLGEDAIENVTIPDDDYPLRIAWDGILVDDPAHLDDLVRRVRDAFGLIWGDSAPHIEHGACDALSVADLRTYFGRPGLFFADHLKRYSKSRRQAPIYWPLTTRSGSYTVWLYYPRLTSDTLFTALIRYVQPKIVDVERQLREARDAQESASGREKARLLERVEELSTLLSELSELRDELKRVTELPYRPDLDDGVIINAAPLHRLFRLPKWAKDTREVWQKLERGDYDWAHMAYTIWPDRVREKCRTDRSLAIAHDLEHLYSGPAPGSTRKQRGRAAMVTDDDDDE